MKRFASAIVIFALVIVTCILETLYIHHTFDNTKNTVQALKTKCLNGDDLTDNEFNTLTETWEKQGKCLAIFINREQLSTISDKIHLLKTAYLTDKSEFILLTEEITVLLEEIEKIESINTFGIL